MKYIDLHESIQFRKGKEYIVLIKALATLLVLVATNNSQRNRIGMPDVSLSYLCVNVKTVLGLCQMILGYCHKDTTTLTKLAKKVHFSSEVKIDSSSNRILLELISTVSKLFCIFIRDDTYRKIEYYRHNRTNNCCRYACLFHDGSTEAIYEILSNMAESVNIQISISSVPNAYVISTTITSLSRSEKKSTRISQYENVIRNETYRMIRSIDIVGVEAMYLFGPERTQIFFDILVAKSFHFVSARAMSEFVPDMAESAIRMNVFSFFKHTGDVMNHLMTSLLSCPDYERVQHMTVQLFISLMQSTIESSLDTKTNKRERLCLEGNRLIMVQAKEFEKALGVEILEDVLKRLKRGDEMVVHWCIDTSLERSQPSEKRKKMIIYSIYFPTDCRLFIHIPTENGSYWHKLDMQRASRIIQHG